MTHDEMIAVIQAHKDGKQVESKPKYKPEQGWSLSMTPGFNFNAYEYRVKQEPRTLHCVYYKDQHDGKQTIYGRNFTEKEAKELVEEKPEHFVYAKFVEVIG